MIREFLKGILISLFFLWISVLQICGQDFDAEILKYNTRVNLAGNKLVTEYEVNIRINAPGGDAYSHISIPYSSMVAVSDINGQVKDATGKIVQELQEDKIVSMHAGSEETFYDDQMIYYFILTHRKYPYIIEYSYKTTQEEYLHIVDWTPILGLDIPTYSARLELNIPGSTSYRIKEKNMDPAIRKAVPGGEVLIWQSAYTDLLKEETYSPPLTDLAPLVSVIPEEFTFDIKGSTRNWQEFGAWIYRLSEGKQELPAETVKEIRSSIEDISDTLKIIEKLYHRLQDDTRYVFIAIESGGLKPYSAEYVDRNHFGDCKALSNYFRAVLQVAGIESYYSLVNSGLDISRIDIEYPSQQFNHVILMVPHAGDTLWVDCTSDGAFAFAGSMIQNRKALVVDKEKSYFTDIPMLKEKDVLNVRKVILYNVGDTVNADFTCNYKGGLYEFFVLMEKNAGMTSLQNLIRNLITEPDFELVDYEIENFHRDSANIDFSYSAKSTVYYSRIRDEIHISPLTLHAPVFNPPEERQNPVQIPSPLCLSDTLEYILPADVKILYLPADTVISTRYGHYSLSLHKSPGKIYIVKDLVINPGDYDLEEYASFYAFMESVMREELYQRIILKTESRDEKEM